MNRPQPRAADGTESVIALPDALREKLRRSGPPAAAPPRARHPVVDRCIAAWRDQPGALLPLLHAVQDALGHVPPQAVPDIAEALNLSRAEVHGVLTYYHHFRTEPAGRHVLQLCRAEACRAMGSEQLWQQACSRLGLPAGGTRADAAATLEAVYCLGLCASSPAAQLDDRLHARLTPQRLDALLAPLLGAAGEAP